MVLPKPHKKHYTLKEIAKELGWKVRDVLSYGEQGLLELCFDWNNEYDSIYYDLRPADREGLQPLSKTNIARVIQQTAIVQDCTPYCLRAEDALNRILAVSHEEWSRFKDFCLSPLGGAFGLDDNQIDNAELLKDFSVGSTQNSNEPAKKNPIPDKDRITSTTPFTQAIEKMYRHYYDKGEYDLIKPDYVDAFIQKMGKLLKKENIPHPTDEMELIKYLAVRIKSVKKSYGAWEITTEEIELPAKRLVKNTAESTSYDKDKVTKKLCLLRKKYPIPCTIPIP